MLGGVDVGGTKIQAVVVDGEPSVLGEARRQTPRRGGPGDVADSVVEALTEAAERAGAAVAELAGVGVGSPGAVDTAAGNVTQARNLPGWSGSHPLAAHLGERLGVPVRVGNDVQVAMDAELALGAGRDYASFLGVAWGTGVGGGIVLDGRPWLGRGAAAEIGHMVVREGGAKCPCGRRGCLEAYAGRAAMERAARRAHRRGEKTRLFQIMEARGRDRLTSGVWSAALEQGDKLATKLVDRAVAALAAAIASAINLLDVEAVILAGGLGTRLGQPYAERIAREMLPHLFNDDRPPAMRVAALGDLGGAVGATLLLAPAGVRPRVESETNP